MPEQDDGAPPHKQPFSHEDMVDSIRRKRTTGKGRGGRRKRRSHQPRKEIKRRRKRFLLVTAAIVIPLLLLGGALVVTVKFRLESESFQAALAASLAQQLGAEVEIGPVRVRGMALSTPSLTIREAMSGCVKTAELVNVQARLAPASLIGSHWRISELSIDDLDVTVDFSAAAAAAAAGASAADRPVTSAKQGEVGLGKPPVSWTIESFIIQDLSVSWLQGEADPGEPPIGLDGVRVVSRDLGGVGLARALDGTVRLGKIGDFELESADLSFQDGVLALENGSLLTGLEGSMLGFDARLPLSGKEPFGISSRVTMLSLDRLLPRPWQDKLRGRLSGDLSLRLTPGSGALPDIEGEMTVNKGVFRGLRVLDALSRYCNETALVRVELEDKFRFGLHRKDGVLQLQGIEAEKKSVLRLSGDLRVSADESLEGSLEIGVPEAYLVREGRMLPSFFSTGPGGFVVATMGVKGSVSLPEEDLSERLWSLSGGAPAPSPAAPSSSSSSSPSIEARGQAAQPDTGASGETGAPPGPRLPSVSGSGKEKMEQLFEALLE